ncbi:hypothetical protein GBN32_17375 [Plesiomonas shigelloides]|uniref:hypothetical protein n=1 Tax=Plesiomonas shigelloides TaxID=703 RepID=UPI001261443E|nr:hypothetical protein [Plesiomonas shigelloides]KAB7704680.1 hypothetical protein GBN32_17375 [Plesiomonas shigelloides]
MPTFNLRNNTGKLVYFHVGSERSERADLKTEIQPKQLISNIPYKEGQYLACGIARNPKEPFVNEIFYNQEIEKDSTVLLTSPHDININLSENHMLLSDAEGTEYSIDFQNDTPDTWTLCVYQTLPDSPGLDSVSWKQTTVPSSGESGVEWSISYLAAIVDYKQTGGKGVYKASQKKTTTLGEQWDVVFKDNVQQLIESGPTTDGQLLINNKSGLLSNLAIGMDGSIALVKRNVYNENSAQFNVKPKYWVALYSNLTQGEVISGNQLHEPIEVVFGKGETNKKFIARIDGHTFVFEEENSQRQLSMPYSQILSTSKKLAETEN